MIENIIYRKIEQKYNIIKIANLFEFLNRVCYNENT